MKFRRLPQLFLVSSLAVLASCSSKPQKTVVKSIPKKEINRTAEAKLTAQDYIEQLNLEDETSALGDLVSAINAYSNEQEFNKAVYLASQATVLTSDVDILFDLHLAKAKALLALNQPSLASGALVEAKSQLQKLQQDANKQASYYKTLALVEEQLERPIKYLDALLRHQAIVGPTDAEINATWLALNQLAQWQIEQLIHHNPPQINGWQQLLNFSHRFGFL